MFKRKVMGRKIELLNRGKKEFLEYDFPYAISKKDATDFLAQFEGLDFEKDYRVIAFEKQSYHLEIPLTALLEVASWARVEDEELEFAEDSE